MALTWKDRIKVASATTGTGTLTLGAAASGYRTFAAGDDGKRFDIVIEDGTAWETARNCLYTHSGTTLTRGTFSDSSTGSVISCSGAENVFVDLVAGRVTSDELTIQTYIAGLLVTKHTGSNTLDISAGSCYDPSSNKIISYAGGSAVSAGSLGASQWNQVYIYDNAGTVSIEVVNNADPPSTTYAGTARQGGTNSNRRWIGSFLTTSGSAIHDSQVLETAANQIKVVYNWAVGGSPSRVLSAGTASTLTAVSLVTCLPRYVAVELWTDIITALGTAPGYGQLDVSVDGTNICGRFYIYVETSGSSPQISYWMPMSPSVPQVYYAVYAAGGATPSGYLDVIGYRAVR